MSRHSQLALFRWLVSTFPNWLERPDHQRMLNRMLARIMQGEGSE